MTSPTSRMPAPGSPTDFADAAPAPAPRKPPETEELADEYIHRPLARRLVAVLVHTPITPNQVTLLSMVVGVTASWYAARGAARPAFLPLAAGLLLLSVVLDCCDGQLARLKKISSTTGAILDGIADYVVGVSVGVAGSYYLVVALHSPWYWAVGLVGLASVALQSALFDHAKTRYIARVSGGYSEREENLDEIENQRRRALQERRYRDALLHWVYLSYSRAQHAALRIQRAKDPEAYRAANAGRMRAWALLGVGTHFALAYLAIFAATWHPEAILVFFLLHITVFNVMLAVLMNRESRMTAA